MEPIKTIRLSEKVMEAVKTMIKEENFMPGEKFYSEHELTRRLQVSRASVREAIRILEITGQVNVKQGKGIFITDTNTPGFEAFSIWLKNNREDLFDHFELRMIIDPKAAAKAAEKATEKDIQKITRACTAFKEEFEQKNTQGLIHADTKFHIAIAKSTKNKTLFSLMKTMGENLNEGWISSLHTPGRIEKTIVEHGEILNAIVKRDKNAAEKAMSRHLENALEDIKVYMKEEN
ncbi:MAG: FadR family transcriptional regulator [Spirochaetales bacterium]|nr:FadR family transcriptional regulator [Spirochaetales bacterium]